MRVVNVHEAKTNLSALLDAVLAGEEIILARRNVPIARFACRVRGSRPAYLGASRVQDHRTGTS